MPAIALFTNGSARCAQPARSIGRAVAAWPAGERRWRCGRTAIGAGGVPIAWLRQGRQSARFGSRANETPTGAGRAALGTARLIAGKARPPTNGIVEDFWRLAARTLRS